MELKFDHYQWVKSYKVSYKFLIMSRVPCGDPCLISKNKTKKKQKQKQTKKKNKKRMKERSVLFPLLGLHYNALFYFLFYDL